MKLAKIRQADGRVAVAVVDGDAVAPLISSSEYPTLFHILESSDPLAVQAERAGPQNSVNAPANVAADSAAAPPETPARPSPAVTDGESHQKSFAQRKLTELASLIRAKRDASES